MKEFTWPDAGVGGDAELIPGQVRAWRGEAVLLRIGVGKARKSLRSQEGEAPGGWWHLAILFT